MREWLSKQWDDIKGNFKFWLLLSLPALYGGIKPVWGQLSFMQIFAIAVAIASGYFLALATILKYGSNQELTIHYAGYGLGEGRYHDVTTTVRSYIAKNRLDMVVTNDTLNVDPFPGVKKVLFVQFSLDGRRKKEVIRR